MIGSTAAVRVRGIPAGDKAANLRHGCRLLTLNGTGSALKTTGQLDRDVRGHPIRRGIGLDRAENQECCDSGKHPAQGRWRSGSDGSRAHHGWGRARANVRSFDLDVMVARVEELYELHHANSSLLSGRCSTLSRRSDGAASRRVYLSHQNEPDCQRPRRVHANSRIRLISHRSFGSHAAASQTLATVARGDRMSA
jgi:hypothetical protein